MQASWYAVGLGSEYEENSTDFRGLSGRSGCLGSEPASSGLPIFRSCQKKVAKTWEKLQQRLARHSGSVAAHNLEDRPMLLAAAEDLPPEAWDENLKRWPEVAKIKERLRPRGNAVPQSARPVYLASSAKVADQRLIPSSPTPSAIELGDASSLMGLKTPPYARSPVPPESPEPVTDATEIEFTKDSLSVKDPLSVILPTATSVVLPTAAPMPFLGEGPAENEKEVATNVPRKRFRRGHLTKPSPHAREQVLGKLQYLRDCKDVLGERYGLERRRLELQSDLKKAQKYSPCVPGGKKIGEQAFAAKDHVIVLSQIISASNRTLKPGMQGEVNVVRIDGDILIAFPAFPRIQMVRKRDVTKLGKQEEEALQGHTRRFGLLANAASVSEWITNNGSQQRSDSPATEDGGSGNVDEEPQEPLSPKSNLTGRHQMSTPIPGVSTSLSPHEQDQAMATFEYGELCQQRKVTMPTLGTFALEVRSEPAPLSVGQWSLGDAPLMALAASPLRNTLAGVNECRLAGNRLTNAGVSAIIASLGRNTTIVDLSDNSFDSRGAQDVTDFLSRGAPRLREIDMSRSRLDDHTVAALTVAIMDSCPLLEQMRLSDVQMGMGLHSGNALRELLRVCRSLLLLDVSYNMLQGDGALALVNGLYENGITCAGLHNVNLRWNCLGQGPGHGKVAERLAQVLHDCEVLFHLDISFNKFAIADCVVLAKGVASNHTLWGLHVDGNAATVDADGFMHVLEDLNPEAIEDERNFVKMKSTTKQKKGKKDKKRGTRKSESAKSSGDAGMGARVRSLLPQSRLAQDFDLWQRDLERKAQAISMFTANSWLKGMALPEALMENPCDDGSAGKGKISRSFTPRLQEEWLQMLSQDIRQDFQIPYCSHWRPLLGRPSTSVEHGTGVSCWVCEGWVEVSFLLTPGVSFPEELSEASCVCAFTCIDNFAHPVVLQRTDDGRFEGARFLPPTEDPLMAIFQVDQHLVAALDLPRQRLKDTLRVVLHGWNDQSGSSALDGRLKLTETSTTAETREVNLLFVANVAETRLKRVAAATSAAKFPLTSVPEELLSSRTRPRAVLLEAPSCRVAPSWSLAQSVWAKHPDLYEDKVDMISRKAFEFDWHLVRVKLEKWPSTEVEEARSVLQRNARQLQILYQRLSSLGRGDKECFAVTLGAVTHLLEASGLLKSYPHWQVDTFDITFVVSKRVPKELSNMATVLAADGLVRWQFFEMIARIGSLCRQPEEYLSDAIERIVGSYMLKFASAAQKERDTFRKRFFTGRIDTVFKRSLDRLRTTFDFFADTRFVIGRYSPRKIPERGRKQDSASTMSLREFQEYFSELDHRMFPEHLVPYAFTVGNALSATESSTNQHLELTFVEFLVALGYLLFDRAGGSIGQESRILQEVEDFLFKKVEDLHDRVIQWKSSPLFAHIAQREQQRHGVSLLRCWGMGIPWLYNVHEMMQCFFIIDEDVDCYLTFSEVRAAFASTSLKIELVVLGLEPYHVEEFFRMEILDGSGNITVGEVLSGLARVKAEFREANKGLRFLRETFCESSSEIDSPQPMMSSAKSRSSSDEPNWQIDTECNLEQTMERKAIVAAASSAKVRKRMVELDLSFNLLDLWEYLLVSGRSATIENLIAVYVPFIKSKWAVAKAAGAMRALFESIDTSGDGFLSRSEILAIIGNAETLEEMRRLQVLDGPVSEARFELSLALLFHDLDGDGSENISIHVVVDKFMGMWELDRMRKCDKDRLTAHSVASKHC